MSSRCLHASPNAATCTRRSTTPRTRSSHYSSCTHATSPAGSATCRTRRTIQKCRESRSVFSPAATPTATSKRRELRGRGLLDGRLRHDHLTADLAFADVPLGFARALEGTGESENVRVIWGGDDVHSSVLAQPPRERRTSFFND